jgi:hypothetical protein
MENIVVLCTILTFILIIPVFPLFILQIYYFYKIHIFFKLEYKELWKNGRKPGLEFIFFPTKINIEYTPTMKYYVECYKKVLIYFLLNLIFLGILMETIGLLKK